MSLLTELDGTLFSNFSNLVSLGLEKSLVVVVVCLPVGDYLISDSRWDFFALIMLSRKLSNTLSVLCLSVANPEECKTSAFFELF